MAGKQTRLHARQGEVAVSHTTTDSPLLPVEQIERLQQIAPGRVDWVFDQTQLESEHRRREMTRVNTLVFVERMAGLIFALVIAVLGLGLATYLALNDKQLVASVIGGATLVGLVVAFVGGKRSQDKKP
ncbi:hypothetical protein B9Z51_09465 [Limnohabitans sp. T6-5]|uniref:hypothetical protein n=1 Tax=Limnohabitans sp. T6-5 TaxID=1100724 RepID=UPI000D3B688C|nr:hypothetical protein [Limnohabitans sp. T6-5]PUE09136.1 hypothetical protein B9Z51_09465 [Limnohabitans sp. T6-5]